MQANTATPEIATLRYLVEPDVLFIDAALDVRPSRNDARRRSRRAGAVGFPNVSTFTRSLLSVPEAADYLGISVGTMRNWLSMRRIEHVKVGRLTKMSKAALDQFIADNTIPGQVDANL